MLHMCPAAELRTPIWDQQGAGARLLYAEPASQVRSTVAHEVAAVYKDCAGATGGLDVHCAACLRIRTLLTLQTGSGLCRVKKLWGHLW